MIGTPARALAGVASLLFSLAAAAADLPAAWRASIDAGVANGRYRSVVAIFLDHGERSEALFGKVTPDGAAPTLDDAYEIGSTTRSFTGLLLAQALIANKVRLSDTLSKWFPEVRFADPALGAATIEALATHRAGLPAIPPNLFPRRVDDPYLGYDEPQLLAYLGHGHVEEVGRYRYSDLGLALVGEVLARAYATEFRHLLAEATLAPLGLAHSGFGSVPRLVDGFRDGAPALHWQFQALAAASGLRATAGDLERFATITLKPDASPLRTAILLAREPRAAAGGGDTALAWQVVPVASNGQSWPLLWQAGITGGFASFVGLRTDRQQALVLVGNEGIDLSALGLTLLAGREAPLPPPHRVVLDAGAMSAYEGLYRFDAGGDLVVRRNGETLTAQLGGLLPETIAAYDDDAFELAGETSQLTFERQGQKVTGAVLHYGGTNRHAQRLSEAAPVLKRTTTAIDKALLEAYAGDYALSPAVRARIAVAGTGLRAQLTGSETVALGACGSDRFCDDEGVLEIAFARDAKTGRVIGLDWRQGLFEAHAVREDW